MFTAFKPIPFLKGSPVDYTVLHNYLKIIADLMHRLDENSRADLLLKLAIDGGEYCGSGKFNTVSDAYLSIVSEAATPLPLELKVLAHLQLQRIRIFQNLYRQIEQASPINQAAAASLIIWISTITISSSISLGENSGFLIKAPQRIQPPVSIPFSRSDDPNAGERSVLSITPQTVLLNRFKRRPEHLLYLSPKSMHGGLAGSRGKN